MTDAAFDRTHRPDLVLGLEDLLLYAEARLKLCEPDERDHWRVIAMGLARLIEQQQRHTREALRPPDSEPPEVAA
jgi:hypothetical protein